MRSSNEEQGKPAKYRSSSVLLFAVALAAAAVILLGFSSPLQSAEEKRLTIYIPGKVFSVSVVDRGRTEYVDLLPALDPLGRLDVRQDRSKWKLRLNGKESQFQEGKDKVKVRGHDFRLAQPFASEQGRALIPLASLPMLLQEWLGAQVSYHAAARRLFLENTPNPFSTQFVSSTPPRLVFNFAGAVSPEIANEPGRMQIVFRRDPVIAGGPDALTFKDNTITSSRYEEKNGQAEITIQASAPLIATFSNGGKTLTVTPAPVVAAAKPPLPIPTVSPAPPAPKTNVPGVALTPRLPQHRFLVAIDPSHGGDERGAALSDTLAEKDVALALARILRHELQARGVDALLLRDGNTTMSTDQRAVLANTNRAALYITIHAGSVGSGVRLYTSLLPAETQAARGEFIPWGLAQGGFLNSSRSIAAALAGEMQSRQIEVRVLSASLPPLNHVAAPAIGVEVAPPAGTDVKELTSVTYQQAITSALAAGVASQRQRAEVGQ